MKHVALTLAVVVTLVLCPHLASAQSWLYVTLTPFFFGTSTLVEVPLTSAGLGSPQRQISLPGRAGRPVVTFDGRYVAFPLIPTSSSTSDPYTLVVFDRRSGGFVMFPGFASFISGYNLVSDPTTLRLFVVAEDLITVLDPTGRRDLPIPAIDASVRPVLSSNGKELFVARYRTDGPSAARVYHVDVLDPLTGVERRTLPELLPELLPGRLTSMALSHDRQRLFLTLYDPVAVRVVDATSGAELLSRGPLSNPPAWLGPEVVGEVHFDDRNNRLFLYDGPSPTFADPRKLYVLDASTLNIIGTSDGTPTMAVDRAQGLVVTAGTGYSRSEACFRANVNVWGRPTTPLSAFTAVAGGCPWLTVATPPDAPTNLTHTVDGRGVTFNWSSIPGATGYVIEAGSSSGGADLGRIQTTQPSFDLALVPPGIYFVRARALNDVGPSAPSNEVIVNVQ